MKPCWQPALFSLALGLCAPWQARAAGQGEWQVGGHVTGTAVAASQRTWGAGGGLELQRGLSDAWAVRGAVDAAWTAATGTSLTLGQLTAGVVYTWDVVRWLPVFEAGATALVTRGGGSQTRHSLGLQVGVGADYLIDRRWSVGVVTRFAYFPSAADPTQLANVVLRLLYRFN